MFTGTQLLILTGIFAITLIAVEIIRSIYRLLDTSMVMLGTIIDDRYNCIDDNETNESEDCDVDFADTIVSDNRGN